MLLVMDFQRIFLIRNLPIQKRFYAVVIYFSLLATVNVNLSGRELLNYILGRGSQNHREEDYLLGRELHIFKQLKYAHEM